MLPPESAEYFKRLCSKRFADMAVEFSHELREFERSEAARGQFGGGGHTARMAGLFEKHLKAEARAIVAMQREVHAGFGSPLGAGVVEQLQAWGLDALEGRFDAMTGAFTRQLGRRGIAAPDVSNFAYARALTRVTVSNSIADDLWTMRNVPMKGSKSEAGTVVNINAPTGVVQLGDNNTATVHQQWSQGDPVALLRALAELRGALGDWPELAEARDTIDRIDAALKSGKADRSQVTEWLVGIGAVIQTTASIKPAWDLVKAAAATAGFPF